MSEKKIRLLPEDCLFKQGDEGECAYLLHSGRLDVFIDKKKVGDMQEGEIFGEMALILNQKRSSTIVARKPTEVVEISKKVLEELLLTSNLKLHKVIEELTSELSKTSEKKLPISKLDLVEMVSGEGPIIRALALQIHYRLSKMLV